MAAAGHAFPGYDQTITEKTGSFSALNGSTTIGALLISSTSATLLWNSTSQAQTTVSGLLASGSGSALTEVSGGGYARINPVSSVTCSTSGLVTTLSCAALTWSSSTISATYLVFYDFTVNTNDTTRVLICYQDFGGTFADTAGTFTFTPSGSGIATWTAS